MSRITTLLKPTMFAFVLCLGFPGLFNTARAEILNVSIDQEHLNRDYAKIALVHQWNRKDDYVTPTALLKAAVMARDGRRKNEIIKAITTLREQHDANIRAGLRRDWQVSEDYKAMIRHAGGLAGTLVGTYTTVPQLENVTGLVADLGIMTYEYLARDQTVIDASRALGVMYQNIAGAENNIAELVTQTWTQNHVFREVYAEQFEPELRIRPTDTVDTINEKLPHLLLQDNVATILTILSHRVPITEQNVSDIRNEVTTILRSIRETGDATEARKKSEFAKERDRLRRDGLRSSAFLASTALGYIDPTMGTHVQALSSAAFQIHDSITAFKAATEIHKDLTGAASLTLTANFVGAAFTLVGAFGSSGPTPEQMLFEQIAALRKDLQNVRLEMHDRFGIVERKMSIMYVNLDMGIRALEVELHKQDRKLDGILTTLGKVRNQITAGTELLFDRTVVLESLMTRLEIGGCVRWKKSVSISMSPEKFSECLFGFQTLFSPSYLQSRQVRAVESGLSDNLVKWLREKPNEMVSVSASRLNKLVDGGLPDVMIGPVDWQYIATLYLDFLADWPDHLRIAEKDGLDLGALKTGGGIVEGFRAAAKRELMSFSKGEKNNAVKRLLHRVEDRKSALTAAIADRKEQYDQEKFRKHIPKMEPITDPKSCSFHSGSNNQFEGVGYIAELPRDIESVLPEVVKRLLFVGMGSVEYCLEVFYQRGVSERGAIDEMYQNVLVASIGDWTDLLGRATTYGSKSTSGTEDYLLADTEGIYYFKPGGPYTVILKLNFVLSSLECGAERNGSGRVGILELSAIDANKTIRGTGFHGSNEPRTRMVAPKSIWDTEWRDRFLGEAILKMNEDAEECLKTNLGKELMERSDIRESDWVANRIIDGNDPENQGLNDLDEDTELDYALLSHWLWSGFGDAAETNDLLGKLIVGTATGPTLISSVAETLLRDEMLVSEALERYSIGVERMREALRSEEILGAYKTSKDNFGIAELLERIEGLVP